MNKIGEFVLARVAEDEMRRSAYWHDMECPTAFAANAECTCGSQARVLAECEAKKMTVRLWSAFLDQAPEWAETEVGHLLLMAKMTLSAQAAVYSDHPDYREEWKL